MDYNNLKNVADRLITGAGMVITLTRYQDSSEWVKGFDPVKRMVKWTKVSDGTVVYEAPAGLFAEYPGFGVRGSFKFNEIDGDNIKSGDIRLTLTTGFPEPKMGDVFLFPDGTKVSYVSHRRIAPATDTLIYIVQARN